MPSRNLIYRVRSRVWGTLLGSTLVPFKVRKMGVSSCENYDTPTPPKIMVASDFCIHISLGDFILTYFRPVFVGEDRTGKTYLLCAPGGQAVPYPTPDAWDLYHTLAKDSCVSVT